MTKQEFIEQSEAVVRTARRSPISLTLLSFGGSLVIAIVVLVLLIPWIQERKQEPWVTLVLFAGWAAMMVPWMLITSWRINSVLRKHNMRCPQCGRLFGQTLRQIAIATGNCGYCGGRVITDQ